MQLNIKDPETCEMVARLAQATGQTKAGVVKQAVRNRLDEVEAARAVDMAERIARVRELTAQIRSRMPKPLPTQRELDDWMYDEHGLPR